MNEIERAVILALIERAIKDGCLCSVNIGDECLIEDSRDPEAILAVMSKHEDEEDWLYLRNNIGGMGVGGFSLIYGSDEAVINDFCWFNDQEERVKAIQSGVERP